MNFYNDDIARCEQKTTTKKGVDIYDIKSPGLHSFCLCLYAKGGVLYENAKEIGISHFVEHIVFRNINILMGGKLYDFLDESGLTFTAATYKEFMQFSITGETSKFPVAADIITKLFESLDDELSTGDFELERGRIRAEIREYDEKSSLDYLVKKKVWQASPAADMITGTLGSVSKITLSKCEKARKEIFSKGNFFFYVTGNVLENDIEYLGSAVDKYDFCEGPKRENICPLPSEYMKRCGEILTKDSSYYMVEMCFDMDIPKARKEVRNLFYDLMFSGENCRFFRELSENLGYIYSYDAKIEEYKNCGNISISYEVAKKNLYESISAAANLFKEMKNNAEGLSRAKVYYTDNACLMLDNAEELNWTMAYENHILCEGVKSIKEKMQIYEKVTEYDITKLAKEVFRKSNLVVGIKGRKKNIDTAKILEIFEVLGI